LAQGRLTAARGLVYPPMLRFLILCAPLSWPLQLAASANPGWALLVFRGTIFS
jgi:hypothetical protein